MTLFKGMLLFDIAEEPIGNWENQLGYRGMMEVWKHNKTEDTIIIESYEDCKEHGENCECQEVWMHDKNGKLDTLGFYDTFEEADQEAKQFMKENPKGAFENA